MKGIILNEKKFDFYDFLVEANNKKIIFYSNVLKINDFNIKEDELIIVNVNTEMDLYHLYYNINIVSRYERFFYIIVSNKLYNYLRKRKNVEFKKRFILQ